MQGVTDTAGKEIEKHNVDWRAWSTHQILHIFAQISPEFVTRYGKWIIKRNITGDDFELVDDEHSLMMLLQIPESELAEEHKFEFRRLLLRMKRIKRTSSLL